MLNAFAPILIVLEVLAFLVVGYHLFFKDSEWFVEKPSKNKEGIYTSDDDLLPPNQTS